VRRALLRRIELHSGGLYATLTLAIALLAFALPTLLFGSGFLAAYGGPGAGHDRSAGAPPSPADHRPGSSQSRSWSG
jgi:hypothetical protein